MEALILALLAVVLAGGILAGQHASRRHKEQYLQGILSRTNVKPWLTAEWISRQTGQAACDCEVEADALSEAIGQALGVPFAKLRESDSLLVNSERGALHKIARTYPAQDRSEAALDDRELDTGDWRVDDVCRWLLSLKAM